MKMGRLTIVVILLALASCTSHHPTVVVTRIPVDGVPGLVVSGDGAIWSLQGHDSDPLTLLRIDPATDRVTRVSLPPTVMFGRIAVADGGVWVASCDAFDNQSENTCPEANLLKIDPSTGGVLATVPVGLLGGTVFLLAGEGAVWIEGLSTQPITRVDVRTELVTKVHLPCCDLRPVAIGLGSVWLSTEGGPGLVRIDPLTGGVQARIDVRAGYVSLAEKAAWAIDSGGMLDRIDPATNGIVTSIAVPGGQFEVQAGEGAVWLAGRPPTGRSIIVIRVDPGTNQLVGQPIEIQPLASPAIGYIGGEPHVFTAGLDERIWLTNFSNEEVIEVSVR
jgi:streptogramin lyase